MVLAKALIGTVSLRHDGDDVGPGVGRYQTTLTVDVSVSTPALKAATEQEINR
jgi:hypothetical protein